MSNQSSAGQKAARAASAAVNIARGAAAGGVYGAAVEAAKSFLPELIRLFVILLCVVLLVPMLVFTALPNILFGYSSSTDQEIIDFTASAQELDGIYQNLDNYQQPAVLRLVNSILPRFWSDGEPLYDDYGVDQDLGYMNKYWLMAIGSVRYKQDLYTMDESAIEDMMYDRLTYSTSLIDRILNIFVRDLTPEEYMDKLNLPRRSGTGRRCSIPCWRRIKTCPTGTATVTATTTRTTATSPFLTRKHRSSTIIRRIPAGEIRCTASPAPSGRPAAVPPPWRLPWPR